MYCRVLLSSFIPSLPLFPFDITITKYINSVPRVKHHINCYSLTVYAICFSFPLPVPQQEIIAQIDRKDEATFPLVPSASHPPLVPVTIKHREPQAVHLFEGSEKYE